MYDHVIWHLGTSGFIGDRIPYLLSLKKNFKKCTLHADERRKNKGGHLTSYDMLKAFDS